MDTTHTDAREELLQTLRRDDEYVLRHRVLVDEDQADQGQAQGGWGTPDSNEVQRLLLEAESLKSQLLHVTSLATAAVSAHEGRQSALIRRGESIPPRKTGGQNRDPGEGRGWDGGSRSDKVERSRERRERVSDLLESIIEQPTHEDHLNPQRNGDDKGVVDQESKAARGKRPGFVQRCMQMLLRAIGVGPHAPQLSVSQASRAEQDGSQNTTEDVPAASSAGSALKTKSIRWIGGRWREVHRLGVGDRRKGYAEGLRGQRGQDRRANLERNSLAWRTRLVVSDAVLLLRISELYDAAPHLKALHRRLEGIDERIQQEQSDILRKCAEIAKRSTLDKSTAGKCTAVN